MWLISAMSTKQKKLGEWVTKKKAYMETTFGFQYMDVFFLTGSNRGLFYQHTNY